MASAFSLYLISLIDIHFLINYDTLSASAFSLYQISLIDIHL